MTDDSQILQPDAMFGKHRIVRLLGRGGMGEVYEVEDELTGDRHALKVLSEDVMDNTGAVDCFQREARVMSELDHPGIVKVGDFGKFEGRHYLLMELATGRKVKGKKANTLQEYVDLRGGRLPVDTTKNILKRLLDGLGHAHGKGLVHKDLKPSNVLFFGNYEKITDFGLVDTAGADWMETQIRSTVINPGEEDTLIDSAGGGSRQRSIMGTYAYMSPEQKKGKKVDFRSDLYSMGLMAFRMLTGEELGGLERPSELAPGISAKWDDWIKRALSNDPRKRFTSAKAMRDALPAKARPRPASKSVGVKSKSEVTSQRSATLEDGSVGKQSGQAKTTELRKWPGCLVACLLILIWVWFQFFKLPEGDPDDLFAEARDAYEEGRYEDAEDLAEDALVLWESELGENHPKVASCYVLLAAVEAQQRDFDDAMELAQEAVDIYLSQMSSEDATEAKASLADTLAKADPGKAVEYLEDTIPEGFENEETVPEDLAAKEDISQNLEHEDTVPEDPAAKEAAEKASEYLYWTTSYATKAREYERQGRIYWETGYATKAIEVLEKALAIKLEYLPEDHWAISRTYNLLGLAYDDDGKRFWTYVTFRSDDRYEKAKEYFEKSIASSLQPSSSLHHNLGSCYLYLDQYAEAVENLEKAVELGATNWTFHFLIEAYRKLADETDQEDEYFPKIVEATDRYITILEYSVNGEYLDKETSEMLRATEQDGNSSMKEAAIALGSAISTFRRAEESANKLFTLSLPWEFTYYAQLAIDYGSLGDEAKQKATLEGWASNFDECGQGFGGTVSRYVHYYLVSYLPNWGHWFHVVCLIVAYLVIIRLLIFLMSMIEPLLESSEKVTRHIGILVTAYLGLIDRLFQRINI